MANIITSQAQVPAADTADLVATYQHLTGRAVTRFSSRAVAERRVIDAMMSGRDAAGHLGIPRGTDPKPTAMAELVDKAAATGRADPVALAKEGLPGEQAGVETDPGRNPYPAGTLAARLWAQAEATPAAQALAPTSRVSGACGHPAPRVSLSTAGRIAITGTGTARVLATSDRGKVLATITAAGPAGISLADILAVHGPAARGHLGKLRATQHITNVSEASS